ncbi:MAG: thioredoxin domain-containing protein, partial [Halobacteriovoraceae bacterium]|nr:thioredoxin domain-containing protein [Halobacteriovoraceae bacterium]
MNNATPNRLTDNATIGYQALLLLSAILMLGFSIYLTNHYFEIKFPTGLTGGSLCNINDFFNCDKTTLSPFSNILGVPIALFGALIGAFVLLGYLFNNLAIEGTNHFILIVNAVGCLILFLYSLIALGGLCPFCSLYYVFSWAALAVYWKFSETRTPNLKVLLCYGLVFILAYAATKSNVNQKFSKKAQYSESLVKQYNGLQQLGHPKTRSGYNLAVASVAFDQAPIRITKFSDFQCPGCKMFSEVLHKLAKKYEGKIAIEYMFYPLDNNCNESMKSALHQHACQAAYLATCLPAKFPEVHDRLFEKQNDLSSTWIEDYAKKEGVLDCYKSEATMNSVKN